MCISYIIPSTVQTPGLNCFLPTQQESSDTTHLDSNGKSPAAKIMTYLKVRNCFLDMNCQKHH